MKVAVGLLTVGRPWLLKTTLYTLRKTAYAFKLVVMDNGSLDEETSRHIAAARPDTYMRRDCLPVGEAQNELVNVCLSYQPDLIVLTADDYEYENDWLDKLVAWWEEAPADVAITSMNWEPVYPWNTHTDTLVYGKQRGLVRNTVPGSSWSFKADMWGEIGPLQPTTGGEDGEACRRLRDKGRLLCALDLSVHTGERQSAWGNNSWKIARPLEV